MPATVFDDLLSGPGLHDPYPVYQRWREAHRCYPVYPKHWLITRHADVSALLRDNRFRVPQQPKIPIPVLRTIFRMFKFLDPPIMAGCATWSWAPSPRHRWPACGPSWRRRRPASTPPAGSGPTPAGPCGADMIHLTRMEVEVALAALIPRLQSLPLPVLSR